MTLEEVLYNAKSRTTGSWKDIFMKHPLLHFVFVTLLVALVHYAIATPCESSHRRTAL